MRTDAKTGSEAGASGDPYESALWYRSRSAWRFMLARFVPLLVTGNLLWEAAQLPFYTIWREGSAREKLFAIVHCTAGDVMIGTAALLASVMLFGRRGWPGSNHGRVLATATFAGLAYTVFSEWVNTHVTMSWRYADSMFLLPPLGTGITPLLQWVVVPPLAYWVAIAADRMANAKRTLST